MSDSPRSPYRPDTALPSYAISTRLHERSPRSLKELAQRDALPYSLRSRSKSPALVPVPARREALVASATREQQFPFLLMAFLGLCLLWLLFSWSSSSSASTTTILTENVNVEHSSAAGLAELSSLFNKQLKELQAAVSQKASNAEIAALVERQKQDSATLREALLSRIDQEKQDAVNTAKDLLARIQKLDSDAVTMAQVESKLAAQMAELEAQIESKLRIPKDQIDDLLSRLEAKSRVSKDQVENLETKLESRLRASKEQLDDLEFRLDTKSSVPKDQIDELEAKLEAKLRIPQHEIESIIKSHVSSMESSLIQKTETLFQLAQKPVAERKKDFSLEISASSPTFKDFDILSKYAIKVLGVSVKRHPLGPETVIAPFVENACWAFAGNNGTLTIQLRQRTLVGSLSLQQTEAPLSFFLAQAPKDVEVVDTVSGAILGAFSSKADASFQSFQLTKPKETDSVTLNFKSNHGSKEFTCVGKIRVHN